MKNYSVFATLPVTDYARARAFYKDKLGLTPSEPDGDVFQSGGGTALVISAVSVRPDGHTQMSFLVTDVAAVVKQLKAKGVVFEEYELPTLNNVNSIAARP